MEAQEEPPGPNGSKRQIDENSHDEPSPAFESYGEAINQTVRLSRTPTTYSIDEKPVPWYIITEQMVFRRIWDCLLAMLLLYIAWVFPYRLCFIELKVPAPVGKSWAAFMMEQVVDVLFYVDLVINFFFTFRDLEGKEVVSLREISRNYLKTYFVVNFIACVPPELVELILNLWLGEMSNEDGGGSCERCNEATRLLRLQRASRLMRLMRLLRLAKLHAFINRNSVWQWIQDNVHGVRLLNFMFALFTVAHIMACGWYLTAVFTDWESGPESSWLARRTTGADGTVLREADELRQWLHSLYFIFTVFTTVGFGDISAENSPEIVYVIITMLVGALVNSIFVSEMINVVTHVDEREKAIARQKDLLSAFSKHVDLSDDAMSNLIGFLDNAPRRAELDFDREGMTELFTGDKIPREIIGELPECLYGGKLMQNKLIKLCERMSFNNNKLPPRFPVLLSLLLHRHGYDKGELVYHVNDHAFSFFIVFSGTFAAHAVATSAGGRDEPPGRQPGHSNPGSMSHSFGPGSSASSNARSSLFTQDGNKQFAYQLFGAGSYFGDFEVMANPASGANRRTNMRCVLEGETLLLLKKDLMAIEQEFPQFTAMWTVAARHREYARQRYLKRLKVGLPVKHFAASRIQAFVRARRRTGMSSTDPGVSPTRGMNGGFSYKRGGNSNSVADAALSTELTPVQQLQLNVQTFRTEVRADITGLRDELKAAMAELRRQPALKL